MRQSTLTEALSAQAYMLFYERAVTDIENDPVPKTESETEAEIETGQNDDPQIDRCNALQYRMNV